MYSVDMFYGFEIDLRNIFDAFENNNDINFVFIIMSCYFVNKYYSPLQLKIYNYVYNSIRVWLCNCRT